MLDSPLLLLSDPRFGFLASCTAEAVSTTHPIHFSKSASTTLTLPLDPLLGKS